MNINIFNAQEDQYGNSKENIFIALSEEGNYLGSAYVYPSINFHQTYDTPYLIFLSINIEDKLEKSTADEVKQELFDKVFFRAKELRNIRPDLKARIYSGFEYDIDNLDFYIKNGFEEDYSIIMEKEIAKDFYYSLPKDIKVKELKLNSEKELEEYKLLYDEIFITPLDLESYEEQKQRRYFKNLEFFKEGTLIGGCTVFQKHGVGYIETLYVLPEAREKGISKCIMNYIFDYFISKGLYQSRLEVWQLNKKAVKLYEGFGYKEIKKKLMFPGITV
jgi:GNAT superfamily N-acetyltransferase